MGGCGGDRTDWDTSDCPEDCRGGPEERHGVLVGGGGLGIKSVLPTASGVAAQVTSSPEVTRRERKGCGGGYVLHLELNASYSCMNGPSMEDGLKVTNPGGRFRFGIWAWPES